MRSLWFLGLALLLGVGLLTASCGDTVSADDPPAITYGEDSCSRCHMIISEERFAAGLVDKDGMKAVFDDTGEMVGTVQEEGLNARRAWVHDYHSSEWIDATTAFYVDSHDVITPMGMGVVAFAQRDAAGAFAAEHHGTVRDWNAMLAEWTMHGHEH